MHVVGVLVIRYPVRSGAAEVPPYGEKAKHAVASLYGRLTDKQEWFVQAPVEIVVEGGIVRVLQVSCRRLEELRQIGGLFRMRCRRRRNVPSCKIPCNRDFDGFTTPISFHKNSAISQIFTSQYFQENP